MSRSDLFGAVTCVLFLMAMGGCIERKSAPIGPNVGFGQQVQSQGDGVSAVDLMFVIDNSGSMKEEHENLAARIQELVRDLASPPDRDGDGDPDWNPAQELRIGIVTTDTGMGTQSVPGSTCMQGGDAGRIHGGVFTWREGDDADAFASQVEGVVDGLGTRGCAFEQPLEAAARAVESAAQNDFPRREALFGLIVVTDEEDCSVDNDDAFFSSMTEDVYNVHCTRNRGSLTPVSELLSRIRGDREESEFVFAAIAGLPRDLPAGSTPDAILARPDMQHGEVNTSGLRPRPVCEFSVGGESLGQADPAQRLVEIGRILPDSVFTTICTDDFGPAIGEIAAAIGAQVPGVCLVRELPTSAGTDGVPCEATVVLAEGHECGSLPGYTPIGTTESGRSECVLDQVGEGRPSGFFYDPDRDGCPQLVITDDSQPPLGSAVSVECFVPILRPEGDQCARDSQCETGYCDRLSRLCAPYPEDSEPPLGG